MESDFSRHVSGSIRFTLETPCSAGVAPGDCYEMTPVASLRTEAEAASVLGISEYSLRRLRLAGEGPPCARIGRFPRYHLGLLEEWIIAKSKQESQQDKGSSGHRRQGRSLEIPVSGPRPATRSGRDWTRSYKRKPRSRQEAQRRA